MNDLSTTWRSDRDLSSNRSGMDSGHHRSSAPIPLESLVRHVDALWAHELSVESDLRSELIEELSRLEQRIEVLRLRSESGSSVSAGELRDCAQVLLWLRERWIGPVAA